MPRTRAKVEVNKFNQGLNTDANPLAFPPNFSLDEKNFVLNKNGLRTRRLGFDLEDSYVDIATDITPANGDKVTASFFKWDNAGGDSDNTIVVVQIGNELCFFDASISPLSNGLIYYYQYTSLPLDQKISFASVDGMLVTVTGLKPVDIYVYDGTTISKFQQELKVRDLFAVTDIAPSQ